MNRQIASAAALAALLSAVAAGPAQAAPFSGDSAIETVEALCATGSGRVAVDVRVRYADAARSAERRYAGGRHAVRSTVVVTDGGGMRLAGDADAGTAQVAISGARSYRHTHRHLLDRAASRRVLDGRRCGAGQTVRIRARARQTLAGGSRAGATASATASQADAAAATATVAAVSALGPAINGCIVAGNEQNCQGADLSGQDLSNRILAYSDFSFADLANANLSKARLGHVNMNLTVLDGANMSGALLGSASLTSASLKGADLTGAQGPYANFANAKLNGTKLAGANLSGVNLPGAVFDTTTCDDKTVFPAAFPHVCRSGMVVTP